MTPSKNSTCLSVWGSSGVPHSQIPLSNFPACQKKVQSGLNVITVLCSWQWPIAHLGTIRFGGGEKQPCSQSSHCAVHLLVRPQKSVAICATHKNKLWICSCCSLVRQCMHLPAVQSQIIIWCIFIVSAMDSVQGIPSASLNSKCWSV